MKAFALIMFGLFVFPSMAQGQVEFGLDAGLFVESLDVDNADNLTTFSVPVPLVRVGFAAGDMFSVETLLSFQSISDGDDTVTLLTLLPGANLALGDGGFYVRAEAGLVRVGDGTDSETQYAVGAAAGLKRPIGDGAASFRLEGGFDKWLEDEENFIVGSNEFRALFGMSVVVG